MAKYKNYQTSIYSDLANEAIHDAWLKLPEATREELQGYIEEIIAAQDTVNTTKEHKAATIASGGPELLAKMAWQMMGFDYPSFIMENKK